MSGLRATLSGVRGALALRAEIAATAGEVTALVGPSGAGKSTLLRALAGLERLDGRVEVDGEVWQDGAAFTPPHRRAVGLVFQHAALLPHLSVADNIRYGWKRARRPHVELDRAIALTSTSPLLGRSTGGLSGGERQRVAVARALASGPSLLLLDEPLSGLDAAAKADLLPQLRSLLTGLTIPVVYVSHDAGEVARVSDRVVRMREGRTEPVEDEGRDARTLAGLGEDDVRRLALAALRAGLS